LYIYSNIDLACYLRVNSYINLTINWASGCEQPTGDSPSVCR